MVQVWSATQINGNFTGGGTTVVDCATDSGVGASSVYAATGVSTGKYYWEAQISNSTTNNFLNGTVGLGLGNTSTSVANGQFLGIGFDSLGAYVTNNGATLTWWIGNSGFDVTLGFTVAFGDVLGFALDLVNNTVWFRDVTQGSGWFGVAGSADPAANTNGFSLVQTNFTITSHPVVPGASLVDVGDEVVGFFSAASWFGGAPAGFVGLGGALTAISASYAGRGLRGSRAIVLARGASRYGGSGAFTAKVSLPQITAAFGGSGAIRLPWSTIWAIDPTFYRGVGTFAANANIISSNFSSRARYSGAGAITAAASIQLGPTQLAARFAGAGSLSVPQLITFAVVHPSYAGTGTFAADATPFRPLVGAFLGSGSFFAAPIGGLAAGRATFQATGSITGNVILPNRIDISANFSGAGSLALLRLTAQGNISTAYSGTGTIASAVLAGMPTSTNFIVDELGNQIVDELGNLLVTELQPTSQLTAGFDGRGSLAIARATLRSSGIARYVGAGSFVAPAIIRAINAAVASFAGSGSITARAVANLRGQARFAGVGVFSTGFNIPSVLARCFGADVGVFFPPAIADAGRFGPATASDAALFAVPLIGLNDVQVRFVAASDAARGLSAATDIAAARSTAANVAATSIVVAET